jgi:hypothetical protein
MTMNPDSLAYDVQKIAKYQADNRFDYNSQSDLPKDSLFDLVSQWFNRFVNSIFSGKFEEKYTTPVMIGLFFAAVLSILFFLYKKRPELFTRSRKTTPIPYDIEEENIHAIDFDREIEAALDCADYRLAMRLLYLQTLRFLSDREWIDWQIHKTPTEYVYEIKRPALKQPFRMLTQHFLQIRYGNYDASFERFNAMRAIRSTIQQIGEGEVS